MAIIGLQKGSGKRSRVREKSVKSQGILIWIMSGNPETAFCICKNKGADQLHGNCAADQHLCFRYIDSTIHFLPESQRSSM